MRRAGSTAPTGSRTPAKASSSSTTCSKRHASVSTSTCRSPTASSPPTSPPSRCRDAPHRRRRAGEKHRIVIDPTKPVEELDDQRFLVDGVVEPGAGIEQKSELVLNGWVKAAWDRATTRCCRSEGPHKVGGEGPRRNQRLGICAGARRRRRGLPVWPPRARPVLRGALGLDAKVSDATIAACRATRRRASPPDVRPRAKQRGGHSRWRTRRRSSPTCSCPTGATARRSSVSAARSCRRWRAGCVGASAPGGR